MQEYACGFLFSPDRHRVLLIRKRRPAWQAGKLNGVGGKLEANELPRDAMIREFREEANLQIESWQQILTLQGPDWRGHFFRAFGPVDEAIAITDEKLEIHRVNALPGDTIPNLHWMIPLMVDPDMLSGRYQVQLTAPL